MKELILYFRTMAKDLQSKRSELPPSAMLIAELAYIVSDLQRLAKELEDYEKNASNKEH